MKDDIQKRRGRVVFDKEILLSADKSLLKVIFSKIFPIAIVAEHRLNHWGHLTYYCLSPHFNTVKEGEEVPEYIIEITATGKEYSIKITQNDNT